MRQHQWTRFAKLELLERLPQLATAGRYVYLKPVGYVLGCVYADQSSFDEEKFKLIACAVPLYVPTDSIYFDIGVELSRGRQFSLKEGSAIECAIRDEGIPFLLEHGAPEKLVDIASLDSRNIRMLERMAYSRVLGGDDEGAYAVFARIESLTVKRDWEKRIRARALAIGARIGTARDEVILQLEEWRRGSCKALGLPT